MPAFLSTLHPELLVTSGSLLCIMSLCWSTGSLRPQVTNRVPCVIRSVFELGGHGQLECWDFSGSFVSVFVCEVLASLRTDVELSTGIP